MERKEWRGLSDRTGWDAGPWDDEPDKIQWQDESTGLPCLIVRNGNMGNLCGYVGVRTAHPLHEKSYSFCVPEPAGWENETIGKRSLLAIFCSGVKQDKDGPPTLPLDCIFNVHGGLTYSDKCGGDICHETPEPDHVWWFGFDCAHAGDYSPGSKKYGGDHWRQGQDEYRTVEYVQAECASLAKQLSAVT